MITAVDTNILIDILEPDPVHGLRSKAALKKCLREGTDDGNYAFTGPDPGWDIRRSL